MDAVTETLYVCREVKLYKIPPRTSSEGYKSGEWQVSDKIFTGILKLTASGSTCKITLEDSSGSEFASCLIPSGERNKAVEPVTDSSRYFVLRLIDPANANRRVFLGLGFDDRAEAFDFNVALSDHEKHVVRAKEVEKAAKLSTDPQDRSTTAQVRPEVASMYQSRDLSLKQGQTMTINLKRPGSAGQASSGTANAGKISLPNGPLLSLPSKPANAPQVNSDLLGLAPPPASSSKVKSSTTNQDWATF